MAVKSMEMAVEATTSMEMAPGALPPKFVGGGGGATRLLLENYRLF
jgi:hypothetical protein